MSLLIRLFTFLAIALFASSLYAQPTGRSFTEAIEHFEKELEINFSFDAEAFEWVSPDHAFSITSLADFIREVEELLPVKIEALDAKHYTLSTTESRYSLTLTDSIDQMPLSAQREVYVIQNGTQLKTTVSVSGWSFVYQPSIADTLRVFALGYEQQDISFESLMNKKYLAVSLKPIVLELAQLTIEDYLTKGIDLNPANQSIDIAVSDLPLLPGETDGDIFAAITALPGVTTPDGRAGNLFIRGSETDQSLILFDNIPVYHRGHYYGTISPYNPKIVDEVKVYRSGFHPRLGDRVGGAIVINSSSETPSKPTLGAAANTLYASAYTKVPLANNRIGLSVGVRHSYPRKYHSPKLNAISKSVFAATGVADPEGNLLSDIDVLFEDYHGKLTYQLNSRNRLSLSAIYTNTEVDYISSPPNNAPKGLDHNQFKNLGMNLNWKLTLQNNWTSLFSATASDYTFLFTSHTASNFRKIYNALNRVKDINLRQEFSKTPTLNFSYQFGVDYKRQKVITDFLNRPPGDAPPSQYKQTVKSDSFSPYANMEYHGAEKWYLQMGIRSTYYTALGDLKIAPRILLNYQANDWLTLKMSTGKYNQYLSQARNLEFGGGGFDNELWVLAENDKAHIIEGTQSMAGAVADLNNWIIDIEGYYKTVNNITVFEDRRLSVSQESFTMNQQSYGMDMMFKKQVNNDASVWLGYSFNDSAIRLDTTDHATYRSKYVQPHVLYLGSAVKTGKFKFSAAWNYSSGLNAKSLDIVYAEFIRLRNIQNRPPGSKHPPNPFANVPERYPNVLMFNASASYTIPRTLRRKWEAVFGLSVINVFNQKNLTDRLFRGKNGFIDRYAMGFAPNLMIGIEF